MVQWRPVIAFSRAGSRCRSPMCSCGATGCSTDADRTVAKTVIGPGHVSTVFLAMDHQWGEGLPLLFETVVLGGSTIRRRGAARPGPKPHAAACDYVRESP
jgi:hypothetical protein